MSWTDPFRYDGYIIRALATPGGHLSVGRGGFTLHYENATLEGYDCETVKRAAIAAGLPVIDSRCVPFDLAGELAVRGPMIAVNTEPSPRPWHGLSYAPLTAVAAAYRKAGAEVFNIADGDAREAIFDDVPPGSLGELLNHWLDHVRTHATRKETAMSNEQFIAYEAKCATAAALAAEVLPSNKQALFEALAQAGIHTVVVCFDGSGDSGQVETADGFDGGNNQVQLPTRTIDFSEVDFESSSIRVEQKAAREIVEIMTYDFLRQTHGGWEDNDGAYGELTFDVGERTIALDFNERFTDSTNYQHAF